MTATGQPGPARPTLIISPHLDDAMLSAASVLLSGADRPVTVLTVFAGLGDAGAPPPASAWDLTCGFETAEEALAARRREDDLAFDGLTTTRGHLTLADSAYGARTSDPSPVLLSWVREWLHRQGGVACDVLVPAGAGIVVPVSRPPAAVGTSAGRLRRVARTIGGQRARSLLHRRHLRRRQKAQERGLLTHGDHLLVRDVVTGALLDDTRVSLVLYEELPYLWSQPGDGAARELAGRHHHEAALESVPVDAVEKARRLSAYRSQVGTLDPAGRLTDPAALPSTERFWRLRRSEVEHPVLGR